MELYYYPVPGGNFGDDLNLWFWDSVLPGFRDVHPDVTLVGVGSLLNGDLLTPSYPPGRKLILGSGVGYGPVPRPLTDDPNCDIRSVRGPISARTMGLPGDRGIVDPAALLPELPEFAGAADRKTARPIFVPHCDNDDRHPWGRVCAAAGIDFVSAKGEARQVIRAIAAAPLVLAESMHAAIIADAFRVPWVAVSINTRLNMTKWNDWAQSLGIDLNIVTLFPEFGRPELPAELPVAAAGAQSLAQAGGQGHGGKGRPSTAFRLRRAYERLRITSRLRTARAQEPGLSDADRLRTACEAYRAVLARTAADYGLSAR